ncbi:Zn(2)-C6 fungal-type domain-containing protein [Mycena venus]|uniref:Zn(2)-C6 fungal-type domain-containing protein n=1 Tax=Mycena venus TaxID=2733690 RepID=A0A8H6YKL2_9AGAR|nr:Zn(2)-C6 fungal-type domain-containing protein [Mycena venus]
MISGNVYQLTVTNPNTAERFPGAQNFRIWRVRDGDKSWFDIGSRRTFNRSQHLLRSLFPPSSRTRNPANLPEFEAGRMSVAPAAPVRLPSFHELTIAACCDERDIDLPPPVSRSKVAAGPVRPPPLKVPSSPRASSSNLAIKLSSYSESKGERQSCDGSDDSRRSPGDVPPFSHARVPYEELQLTESVFTRPPHPSLSSNEPHPQSLSTTLSTPFFEFVSTSSSNASSTLPNPYSAVAYDMAVAQPRLKFAYTTAKAGGRTKKQPLSCYFCRERKIACTRPEGEGADLNKTVTCIPCARRFIECRYPTVSRRGQHTRLQSAARKSGASSGSPPADVLPNTDADPPFINARRRIPTRI